jgi:hypothetical protein
MNKARFVVIWLALFAAEVSYGGGGGLRVSVVDKNSNGVQSEIYAESNNTADLKIGTTDLQGKFFDNAYRCNSDRNLIAKPIDRTYFDSPPQPCRSPEQLLVISRLTPNGRLAFGGFSRSFKNVAGDMGQINYAATIETTALDNVDKTSSANNLSTHGKTWCAFEYRVDANKSKFIFDRNKWKQVEEMNEPVSKLTGLDIAKDLVHDKNGEGWIKMGRAG